jgi:putative ribosome biogenesis GTPase RsgA
MQTNLDQPSRKNGQHQTTTPSTTNLKEGEIVDAPGNDGNGSMPEQVKRFNPWRKIMIMMKINNFPNQEFGDFLNISL